jgi:hypothetical protein
MGIVLFMAVAYATRHGENKERWLSLKHRNVHRPCVMPHIYFGGSEAANLVMPIIPSIKFPLKKHTIAHLVTKFSLLMEHKGRTDNENENWKVFMKLCVTIRLGRYGIQEMGLN